ncbi:replication initiator protein A [Sarcina ventriculi]|uniref:replication initiator protein A n=1 Tax=Sarcina ventriculi TaxID=1267 RepID=UPI0018AC0DDB|nr:replication initiator protein A [Sarcina ventriculi]
MNSNKFFTLTTEAKNKFYQIPKAFMTESSKYFSMSSMAKLAYGILRDRHCLSISNGWIDEEQRVYFLFKQQEIAKLLGISDLKTVRKYLVELETMGLLYREKQGFHKPDKLYLLQFDVEEEQSLNIINSDNSNINAENVMINHAGENPSPYAGENPPPNRGKSPTNNTNTNNTNINNTDISSSSTYLSILCKINKKENTSNVNKIYKLYKEYFKNLLDYKKQEINSFIEMTNSDFVHTVLIYCIERNCRTQKYFVDVLRKLIGKGIVTVTAFNESIENYKTKKQSDKLNRNKNYKSNMKSSFNNFKQRNYDFDKLEKQLLGWDVDYDDNLELDTGF